eukprot:scaffold75832_cov39-Cyclotella_meneghiniana.AAC.4
MYSKEIYVLAGLSGAPPTYGRRLPNKCGPSNQPHLTGAYTALPSTHLSTFNDQYCCDQPKSIKPISRETAGRTAVRWPPRESPGARSRQRQRARQMRQRTPTSLPQPQSSSPHQRRS